MLCILARSRPSGPGGIHTTQLLPPAERIYRILMTVGKTVQDVVDLSLRTTERNTKRRNDGRGSPIAGVVKTGN